LSRLKHLSVILTEFYKTFPSNAKRTIPIAIITTLVIVALSYISVSTVLSLMMPYYALDPDTPFTMAFNYVGLSWATYVVNVGAIISLATWFVKKF
jgi:amino acid transporter